MIFHKDFYVLFTERILGSFYLESIIDIMGVKSDLLTVLILLIIFPIIALCLVVFGYFISFKRLRFKKVNFQAVNTAV